MPPVLRKLTRVVLTVLTVLSLLLCAAACVLWARSYWVGPESAEWSWHAGADCRSVALRNGRGRVGLALHRLDFLDPVPVECLDRLQGPWARTGFHRRRIRRGSQYVGPARSVWYRLG